MDHIFLFFAYFVGFDWMPDTVNFTLLDVNIYFCISINLLQLFSRIHLSYLEMCHILAILF